MVEVKILWQGDPIQCMKSFGTKTCSLCMRERLEILKRLKKDPKKLMNSNNELYGACLHNTRFHWLNVSVDKNLSTDDGTNPERVSTCASSVAKTMYNKLSTATSRLCHIIDTG